MASLPGLFQSMSIQDSDPIDNIGKICTALQVKVRELKSEFIRLQQMYPDHGLAVIDTTDVIMKEIEKINRLERHKVDLLKTVPKGVRRGEEFKAIVRVYDQENRLYQGPVEAHVIGALGKISPVRVISARHDISAMEGTHTLICDTDGTIDNTLQVTAGDVTLTTEIKFADYSEEMNAYLQGDTDLTHGCLYTYSNISVACQETRCYNYLLFDFIKLFQVPEHSSLLEASPINHGYLEAFKKFVAAVVYVGRGTDRDGGVEKQRSYDHIRDARDLKLRDLLIPSSPQGVSDHINYLWDRGCGVMILHVFEGISICEAQTRKACMIDAIDKSMLSNIIRGTVTGEIRELKETEKKRLGIRCLYDAYRHYIHLRSQQPQPDSGHVYYR